MERSDAQERVRKEMVEALDKGTDMGLTDYVGFEVRGDDLIAEVLDADGDVESAWQVTVTLTEVPA